MNTILSRSLVALLLIVCTGSISRSQQSASTHNNYLDEFSSQSHPNADPPLSVTGRSYWGIDLGITGSAYVGNQNFLWHLFNPTFDPNTGNPQNDINTYVPFNSLGSGLGFLLGAKAAFPLSDAIDLEGKLRYLTNYTSSSETQTITLASDPSTNQPTVTSNSNGTYSLLLSNLSLAALLNFRLTDKWYAIGGFEFSSLLGNSLAAHQDLTTPGASYFYAATADQSGATLMDHPASNMTDYFVSSRVAVQFGAGTALNLSAGSSTMIDAELLFSIPFTEWLTSDEQTNLNTVAAGYFLPAVTFPKLWYASLTIGIRFPFERSEEAPEAISSSEVPGSTGTKQTIGPDGKVALTGTVTNSNSGQPVDATMTVVDLTNNEVVATDHTDHNGKYSVRVKAPGKYSVTADADGYLFGTSYFQVDDQGRILAKDPDIKLSETKGGRTRLLVFFDFNSADLTAASYPELDRAVRLMKAVPTMNVQIAGYTDSVGTDEYNLDLSQRRANAVREYIVHHGIQKNRVAARGFGKESPIANNGTEDGRAENRRVEFVVLND